MNRATLLVVALACCGACGGGGAPSAESPEKLPVSRDGSIADPCWPTAAMRLSVQHAGEWEPVAEMQGDGAMYSLKRGERHFVGRISNDAVLDAHDAPSMTCIHKQIDVVGGGFKGQYDEKDAYTDSRTRLAVGDDGAIRVTLGDHPPQTGGRVEGVTPRTRRTAVLFVMSLLVAQ